jgi:hypothetical protein
MDWELTEQALKETRTGSGWTVFSSGEAGHGEALHSGTGDHFRENPVTGSYDGQQGLAEGGLGS